MSWQITHEYNYFCFLFLMGKLFIKCIPDADVHFPVRGLEQPITLRTRRFSLPHARPNDICDLYITPLSYQAHGSPQTLCKKNKHQHVMSGVIQNDTILRCAYLSPVMRHIPLIWSPLADARWQQFHAQTVHSVFLLATALF